MSLLRFGLIGFGRFGRHYARLLQTFPGVELSIIANRSHNTLATTKSANFTLIRKTTNADDVFEDKEIDCVIIATPASTHFDFICKALIAGKHVLVEKPMVLNTTEAGKVCELARKQERICMVGFQYVYNDYIRCLHKEIQQKNLGRILYVLGENLYCGPFRSDVSCFMDAGVHELSMLEYLFHPGAVLHVTGKSLNFGISAHDDFTAATIGFANSLTAHLIISRFASEKIRKLTIVGDKATAIFDDVTLEAKLKIFEQPFPVATLDKTQSIFLENKLPYVPVFDAGEPLQNELEHFVDCVQSGKQPITNAEFGGRITEMSETILMKLRQE